MTGRTGPPQEDFPIPEIHRYEKLVEQGVWQVRVEGFMHYRPPFLLRVIELLHDFTGTSLRHSEKVTVSEHLH